MNIGKIDKPSQSGKQDAEFSGDGRSGVVATFLAQHGTAYHPKKGALMVSMPIEGNDGNSFGVAPESNTPTLAEGESAFGNFAAGCYMVFKNDGTIEIFGNVKHTGNTEQTGTQQTNGTITATGDITGAGKSLSTHTHGGVQTGGGNTGTPN